MMHKIFIKLLKIKVSTKALTLQFTHAISCYYATSGGHVYIYVK